MTEQSHLDGPMKGQWSWEKVLHIPFAAQETQARKPEGCAATWWTMKAQSRVSLPSWAQPNIIGKGLSVLLAHLC